MTECQQEWKSEEDCGESSRGVGLRKRDRKAELEEAERKMTKV